MQQQLGAIILAAGKGKRMQAGEINKVALPLAQKPIILHIVQFLQTIGIRQIVVVIGHAKESVIKILSHTGVIFAEQAEQQGTGHALQCGVEHLPETISDVFVVYGDDAIFYTEKHKPIMEKLFNMHFALQNACTFLTIEQKNPTGLGRIIRSVNGRLLGIVEEKDATAKQKKITEINPGCFVFSRAFLRTYLPLIEKSPITGEYYLTSLVDLAIRYHEKIDTVQGGDLSWRGVNTPEELVEAERLLFKEQ